MGKVLVWACSFCGKTQHEVAKIILGPKEIAICDECVNLCVDIINKDTPTVEYQRATES